MTRTSYLAIASALAAGAIFAAPAFTQSRPAAPAVRIQAGDGGTLGMAHTLRFSGAAVSGPADGGVTSVDTASLSPARWDDIRVAAETARPGAGPTRVPGFGQFINNGATSAGTFAFHFDATSDEELFFSVQLPHGYAEGTDLKPHVHWVQKTAETGNVVWGLECTSAAYGTVFGLTSIRSVTTAAEAQYEHAMASFSDISGTGLTISSMLLCRVYRDADNAADTFAADAVLLEIDFHYQVNSVGSASDTSK